MELVIIFRSATFFHSSRGQSTTKCAFYVWSKFRGYSSHPTFSKKLPNFLTLPKNPRKRPGMYFALYWIMLNRFLIFPFETFLFFLTSPVLSTQKIKSSFFLSFWARLINVKTAINVYKLKMNKLSVLIWCGYFSVTSRHATWSNSRLNEQKRFYFVPFPY